MPEPIDRAGDMDEGMVLRLVQEADGDIIVAVLPQGHRITDHLVQFCAPGTGGGGSPRTWAALRNLLEAMRQDQQDRDPGAHTAPDFVR